MHCKVNGQPFFVTCGIGFDGKVSKEFADSDTRGLATYTKETINAFHKYEPAEYLVRVDGKELKIRAFLWPP